MAKERPPVRISAVHDLFKPGSAFHKLWEIPAMCVAILGACLQKMGMARGDLGVSAACFDAFSHPKTRSMKCGTLLKVFLRLGIDPHLLQKHGLPQPVVASIIAMRDEILKNPGVEGYDRDKGVDTFGEQEESPEWKEILRAADELLGGRRKKKGSNHILRVGADDPSVAEAVLALITDVQLKPKERLNTAQLRMILSAQLHREVEMWEITRSFDSLERGGYLYRHKGAFHVAELDDGEWTDVIACRKAIESDNIEALFNMKKEDVEEQVELTRIYENLTQWLADMRSAWEADPVDVGKFFRADLKYHCELAGNSETRQRLMKVVLPSIHRVGSRLGTKEVMGRLLNSHEAILRPFAEFVRSEVDDTRREELKLLAIQEMRKHLDDACTMFTKAVELQAGGVGSI